MASRSRSAYLRYSHTGIRRSWRRILHSSFCAVRTYVLWGSLAGLACELLGAASCCSATSGPRVRGPSALALVARSMDGLEVVDGAGTAVSDTHDVIDLDSALVFREHPAAEPAEALLHLEKQRFELVVVRALAHAPASSLAGVESVGGSAVGLGHARNAPRACDRARCWQGSPSEGAIRSSGWGASRIQVQQAVRFVPPRPTPGSAELAVSL